MQKLTKGFGIIGGIMIFFGIIAYAITQLANWYFYTHMGLGALLIALYVFFNFDSFLIRMRERSTTEGSKVFVYSAIVALIIVLSNVVFFRHSKRWDFTESKVYSLEEQSVKVVQGLKAPVAVTGFFNGKNPQREALRDLLSNYAKLSSQFSFTLVAPDKKPDLASRYQIKDGDIRLVYGPTDQIMAQYDEAKLRELLQTQRLKSIYYFADTPTDENYRKLEALLISKDFAKHGVNVELLRPDAPPPADLEIATPKSGNVYIQFAHKDAVIREVTEQALTNAIIQVSQQQTPTIRFTTGHGEHSITSEEEEGYATLKGAIQNEGYDVSSIAGSLVQGVPAGTDILVIAGPQTPFTKEEAASVQRYLDEGGKAIIMLDPNFSNPKLNPVVSINASGLEETLHSWGIAIGNDIILEKHASLNSGVTTDPYVVVQDYPSHPITQPLKGKATVFRIARSIKILNDVRKDLIGKPLIVSAGEGASWAETNLTDLVKKQRAEADAKDVNGPVILASVTERTVNLNGKDVTSKLVVFGDSDFAGNSLIRSQEFNYDLILNVLNWMWGRSEQISIRAKQVRSSKLLLTAEQTNIIFYVAVLTFPELVLILGLMIYWRRRSR